MDTFEQLINTGDCFTHVSLYQLLREDGGSLFLFIKILAGAGKGSFMAHPTHLLGRHKNEYVDTGKSRDKALRDCLARIKGSLPKTWPTFNHSNQIIRDLSVRSLTIAVIHDIRLANNYRSRFNRVIVKSSFKDLVRT